MPIIKLSSSSINSIVKKIEEIFDLVKARLFGRAGKTLTISFERSKSLPGLYEQALRESGGIPSSETLENLINASTNYIDSLKLKAVNQVVKNIESHISSGVEVTPETVASSINETWDTVSSQLETIVNTELEAAKNVGILDGIVRSNAAVGVDDPVICFIPSRDISTVCDECVKIHLMPDKITPRCWYLSEVSAGYHTKGEDRPSVHELHPNGRCAMTSVLPGYGFVNGKISFIAHGHNELKKQRNE